MSDDNQITIDDHFILAELGEDELVEQMFDDLYDGLRELIEEGTTILLSRGWSAERVLSQALVAGMRIVGIDFRDGILFVPDVLLAANAMQGGMAILRPLLAETDIKPIGKMIIGTGIDNSIDDYFAALEAKEFALAVGAKCRDAAQTAEIVPRLRKERRRAFCA